MSTGGSVVNPMQAITRPCGLSFGHDHIRETKYPNTPDGRYFVVRGRLWRTSNPSLQPDERAVLVKQLMTARRSVKDAKTDADRKAARVAVDIAKTALGERGPVWWNDGASDYNRHLAKNTPYAEWFAQLPTLD